MPNPKHDPSLVVIQLSGGNHYLNTIVPYNDGQYYDNRPTVRIEQEDVLPIDDSMVSIPLWHLSRLYMMKVKLL